MEGLLQAGSSYFYYKMFVESCKCLRLMKSSEAVGLGLKTGPKYSSKN
ncbi:hypothetical protein V6Z12_A12G219200 [Gossypium hirsutum]